MSTTVAVDDRWLSEGGQLFNNLTCPGDPPWQAWYPYYYPVYYSSPARPIKLRFSEVEALRIRARKDKELREILRKFTSLIEVELDF